MATYARLRQVCGRQSLSQPAGPGPPPPAHKHREVLPPRSQLHAPQARGATTTGGRPACTAPAPGAAEARPAVPQPREASELTWRQLPAAGASRDQLSGSYGASSRQSAPGSPRRFRKADGPPSPAPDWLSAVPGPASRGGRGEGARERPLPPSARAPRSCGRPAEWGLGRRAS